MNYISFQYDIEKISIDEAKDIYLSIKDAFPDIPVVAIPSTTSLCTLDRDELKDLVDFLTKFLEENKDD